MIIDKANGNVCFEESTHTYFDKTDLSKKYISVTTLIHSFTNEFDKSFWSAYKALETLIPKDKWLIEKKSLLNTKKFDASILKLYDISENDFNKAQQKILDNWQTENLKSCERGTKIHSELEHSLYKAGKDVDLKKYGIGGKFECRQNYNTLDLEYGVYPEYLIYKETQDQGLLLAGQIDLLIKNGNEIIVADYKTNKKIDLKSGFNSQTRSTSKMHYPLNNLDDCNFMHYTLQLSTYAWMLQQLNPAFVIKDLILIHYDHNDNMTIYHCDYLKTEVERMLIYYKKKIRQENQRLKRKPIEY